jgi:hypothetical protein
MTYIKKGRHGITPGQIKVLISYTTEAKNGHKGYNTTRSQWINPDRIEALRAEGKSVKILGDETKNVLKIKITNPSDPTSAPKEEWVRPETAQDYKKKGLIVEDITESVSADKEKFHQHDTQSVERLHSHGGGKPHKVTDEHTNKAENDAHNKELREHFKSHASDEDDETRTHKHTGAEEEHLVSEKHFDKVTQAASDKEADNYNQIQLRYNRESAGNIDTSQRLHSHEGALRSHPVSEKHKDEDTTEAHEDELIDFDEELHGKKEVIDWRDKYNVRIAQSKILKYGGKENIDATTYSTPQMTKPIYVFHFRDNAMVWQDGMNSPKEFPGKRTDVDAINYVGQMIEKISIQKSITNLIELNNIMKSISDLSNDPDAMINDEMVYNKYQSGTTELILSGLNGKYSVKENGTVLKNTDSFKEAVAKYYHKIADIIDSQTEDKDISLDILGDILLTANRQIRPMIDKLGKMEEKQFIAEFDYSVIDYPFKDDMVLKQSPTSNYIMADTPKVMSHHMMPADNEYNQGTNATGEKPGRKDLAEEDYKKNKKSLECQQPIEIADETKNIAPVSIMS